MSKFNVGDRVVRTGESISGIVRGGEYTVKEIAGNGFDLYLEGFDVPFDADFFTPALTIDKVTEWLSENGYKFTIHKDKVSGADFWSSEDFLNGCLEITTHEEPEFEWGEEVEVRQTNKGEWHNAKFIAHNPNYKSAYKFITTSEEGLASSWKQCRKPKTKVTLDEIAKWKGVDKDRIEIE